MPDPDPIDRSTLADDLLTAAGLWQRLDVVEETGSTNADLAAAARAGTTSPAALRGGTLTITNVGVFGVDGGTPILNPGEAVILCLGAVRPRPWVHEGALAVRQVVELSLSFDHRLVDGELASRFLRDVGALLEDPALALAWC